MTSPAAPHTFAAEIFARDHPHRQMGSPSPGVSNRGSPRQLDQQRLGGLGRGRRLAVCVPSDAHHPAPVISTDANRPSPVPHEVQVCRVVRFSLPPMRCSPRSCANWPQPATIAHPHPAQRRPSPRPARLVQPPGPRPPVGAPPLRNAEVGRMGRGDRPPRPPTRARPAGHRQHPRQRVTGRPLRRSPNPATRPTGAMT